MIKKGLNILEKVILLDLGLQRKKVCLMCLCLIVSLCDATQTHYRIAPRIHCRIVLSAPSLQYYNFDSLQYCTSDSLQDYSFLGLFARQQLWLTIGLHRGFTTGLLFLQPLCKTPTRIWILLSMIASVLWTQCIGHGQCSMVTSFLIWDISSSMAST